jgi:hypothetical protein
MILEEDERVQQLLARRGNQHYNTGFEAVSKGHEHYRAIEGRTGDEDPADKMEDCTE